MAGMNQVEINRESGHFTDELPVHADLAEHLQQGAFRRGDPMAVRRFGKRGQSEVAWQIVVEKAGGAVAGGKSFPKPWW